MQIYTIKHQNTGQTLFEGAFQNFKQTLEYAIHDKIKLNGADLKHQDLSHANLDDGHFKGADFTGSNLTGANLSESNLQNANLSHTALYNACFAYADMTSCIFTGAEFGATDITHTHLNHAEFSGLSCFTLNFKRAKSMKNCQHTDHHNTVTRFSKPPIVITGIIESPVIITETAAFIGQTRVDKTRLERILKQGLKADILNLPDAIEA